MVLNQLLCYHWTLEVHSAWQRKMWCEEYFVSYRKDSGFQASYCLLFHSLGRGCGNHFAHTQRYISGPIFMPAKCCNEGRIDRLTIHRTVFLLFHQHGHWNWSVGNMWPVATKWWKKELHALLVTRHLCNKNPFSAYEYFPCPIPSNCLCLGLPDRAPEVLFCL